ncbi:hypothetical protein ACI3ET_00540 [Ornithinimicrobium sp. LYQ121]|uniref:hypothetical protein n=1 Tax=Ornithinimicrobium sp. LYQ121 TaxID=3378801 RepID=UPI0038523711
MGQTPVAGTPVGPAQAPDPVEVRVQSNFPDLYATVTQGHASFDHVAQARRIRQRDPRYSAESRRLEELAEKRFLGPLDDAIEAEYWCEHEYAGCALTRDGRLLSVSNTHQQDLVVLEAQVRQLGRDVEQVFGRARLAAPRRAAAATLYSVLTRLMATADLVKVGGEPEPVEQALGSLRAEWSLARARVTAAIQRQARFEYLQGVAAGLVLALLLLAVLGWAASEWWPRQINAPAFLAASLSGAVGALVSVLERMTPRSGGPTRVLVLDYTAPRAQKVMIGATRPLVGGIFAIVVYFALLGGLLTIQGPDSQTQDTPATFAFFGLLGFAAGFTERFATDILERAVAPLTTAATPPATAPSTTTAAPPPTTTAAAPSTTTSSTTATDDDPPVAQPGG